MKSGDKVKIMSYKEIAAMFAQDRTVKLYDNLRFVSEMKRYCEKTVTLMSSYRRATRKGYVWNVEDNSWVWHEDSLQPTTVFLKDSDFEI